MKILVFIEHDITYRHFVMSGAFDEIERAHDVLFVFPEAGGSNKRFNIADSDIPERCRYRRIPISAERLSHWKLLFQISQFRLRPGRSWRALRKFLRYLLGWRASLISTMLALPLVYPMYKSWKMKKISSVPDIIGEFLRKEHPDIIIHPTVLDGYFINDLVMFAQRKATPLIAIMNSWDNPTTKRAVLGTPDWMLVWGEQTRQFAIDYMRMPAERTIAFGAAQFDVYRNPPRVDRATFCAAHGIDARKTILLYAGASKLADEFAHLTALEAAIDEGVLGDCAVIYRPHPWGGGGKNGGRVLEHPWRHVVVERSMRPYLEALRLGGRHQFLADYRDTHDVLSSVDLVISPLSTILIEAGMHAKPIVCFLPDEEESKTLAVQSRLLHFEALFQSPIAVMARGDAALLPATQAAIERVGSSDYAEIARRETAFFVEPFEESFAARLRAFIEQIGTDMCADAKPEKKGTPVGSFE